MTGGAPGTLRDHFLVCGAGRTGRTVIRELATTGRSFLVIEHDPAAVAALRDTLPGGTVVEGDATEEECLLAAGIRGARALVATTGDDKRNLVVTVTARGLQPGLRVVARGREDAHCARLRREGALVVSPEHIAGRRLATSLIHPAATTFLNEMLSSPSDRPVRFESVVVTAEGGGAGRTLGEVDAPGCSGLQVVALRRGPAGAFAYNPPASARLEAGDRLVVIGDWHAVDRLAAAVGRRE